MKPVSVREELKFKLNNTRRPILAGTRLSINYSFVDIRGAILFLLVLSKFIISHVKMQICTCYYLNWLITNKPTSTTNEPIVNGAIFCFDFFMEWYLIFFHYGTSARVSDFVWVILVHQLMWDYFFNLKLQYMLYKHKVFRKP